MYFTFYSCVVIFLFNTGLYKYQFFWKTSFLSFCAFCLFCLFCVEFDVIYILFIAFAESTFMFRSRLKSLSLEMIAKFFFLVTCNFLLLEDHFWFSWRVRKCPENSKNQKKLNSCWWLYRKFSESSEPFSSLRFFDDFFFFKRFSIKFIEFIPWIHLLRTLVVTTLIDKIKNLQNLY